MKLDFLPSLPFLQRHGVALVLAAFVGGLSSSAQATRANLYRSGENEGPRVSSVWSETNTVFGETNLRGGLSLGNDESVYPPMDFSFGGDETLRPSQEKTFGSHPENACFKTGLLRLQGLFPATNKQSNEAPTPPHFQAEDMKMHVGCLSMWNLSFGLGEVGMKR